ncbi:MAG: TetR/AcrR family transcriptional regulator [Pseudomonadota bacterium]
MTTRLKPVTDRRTAPHQKRSQQTVDLILSSAAQLLEEVGFERLSTNLICKQAGLTPPALYRYYPNKYAVLKDLGERLMQGQNALLEEQTWITRDLERTRESIRALLIDTIKVTRATPAGIWIMRSLHATPILTNVRLDSHRVVARYLADQVLQLWPQIDQARAFHHMRLGVELGYATIEMVFDETELDERAIVETATNLLTRNLQDLIAQSGFGVADDR